MHACMHSFISVLLYAQLHSVFHLSIYLSFIMLQSKGLNEESKTHVLLLNKAENDMTIASLALRAETAHAEKLRQARSGVCWMYGVIIAETVLLVLLLYIGLSNS